MCIKRRIDGVSYQIRRCVVRIVARVSAFLLNYGLHTMASFTRALSFSSDGSSDSSSGTKPVTVVSARFRVAGTLTAEQLIEAAETYRQSLDIDHLFVLYTEGVRAIVVASFDPVHISETYRYAPKPRLPAECGAQWPCEWTVEDIYEAITHIDLVASIDKFRDVIYSYGTMLDGVPMQWSEERCAYELREKYLQQLERRDIDPVKYSADASRVAAGALRRVVKARMKTPTRRAYQDIISRAKLDKRIKARIMNHVDHYAAGCTAARTVCF